MRIRIWEKTNLINFVWFELNLPYEKISPIYLLFPPSNQFKAFQFQVPAKHLTKVGLVLRVLLSPIYKKYHMHQNLLENNLI